MIAFETNELFWAALEFFEMAHPAAIDAIPDNR